MSNSALAERPASEMAVTPSQLELVKQTIAAGATDAELKLYLYDCQRQGVHPLDRLLHFTKRGGKYTPVTSIDLMRIRAAETGEYVGSSDAEFVGGPNDPDFAATVTVSRKVEGKHDDIIGKFTATARWSEYYPGDQGGHMWRKMPHTMLAKCAEALALRKGFPRQLAGLYAKEELDQADRSSDSGAAVSTPAAAGILTPSVPNGGDSGQPAHPYAGTQAGVDCPAITDAMIAALPDGYRYVIEVRPGSGKVLGELVLHTGECYPLFKDPLVAIARQAVHNAFPVQVEVKVAATSNKPYVKEIHALNNASSPF